MRPVQPPLARLWCHLILENHANRAENRTRLCRATTCQTSWRMVQFGAIRSRLDSAKTGHWEARNPRKWPHVAELYRLYQAVIFQRLFFSYNLRNRREIRALFAQAPTESVATS